MRYFYLFFLLLLISCSSSKEELTAQMIIDKVILYAGADQVSNSKISFKFRDKQYSALRKDGAFAFERVSKKDSSEIKDVITNKGFMRFVNNFPFSVKDSMVNIYSNSVNSVHYFSVLPFGLNDKAVQKKKLPSSVIKGKEYYKIEITFLEDGGGEDFEDVFIYWIGKNDFLIDYLAYSYHTNGGGKRFRVLKEQCIKNGVRFVDYYNFKPIDSSVLLVDIDKAYENNQLKKVSKIILKDIKVEVLK